jgi:sortase A
VTRAVRALAWCGLAVGVGAIAWIAVTLVWGDPFTSLYTAHEQRLLRRQLQAIENSRGPASLELAARRFRSHLRDGQPIGRIVIPRIGLRMVVVQGTNAGDLEKGPGHYAITSLPALGGTVAIAGHRTTWLHPFRHIDDLRAGDSVYVQMPYGTFRYVVTGHRVVAADDWSILRRRPWEKLVLSACHPLYSAAQRWVVFARLQSSVPSASGSSA